MRSWREIAIAGVLALVACGTELQPTDMEYVEGEEDSVVEADPDACATSYLDYNNFGAPFISNWCRGCHSSSVPAGMRQKAPMDVNFDDADDARTWAPRIRVRAATATPSMPPAGGPTDQERALLAEWVSCGTR